MKNIVEEIVLSRYNAMSSSYTDHSKVFYTVAEALKMIFDKKAGAGYKYINHIITTQLSRKYDTYNEQVLIVILEKYE